MAERHPVADLLTDEQRARVAAVTFEWVPEDDEGEVIRARFMDAWSCPLGVAFGIGGSPFPSDICELMGWDVDSECGDVIFDFTQAADNGEFAPQDVKTMLGAAIAAARGDGGA